MIGWPIAHSRSPLIHGFWLKEHGIAGSYDRVPVASEDLPAFVRAMRADGFVGANVTIPHKEAAAALCDRLSPAAERLGVVNTLWFEGDVLCGDTTDGLGFLGALDQEAAGWDERRGQAMVLGAGGAARAIVDALMRRGFDVVVVNRTPERARMLARDLGCGAIPMAEVTDLLPAINLLVNTTAAGMSGQGDIELDLSRLPDHAVVDDIVYVPKVTPLLERACRGEACARSAASGCFCIRRCRASSAGSASGPR